MTRYDPVTDRFIMDEGSSMLPSRRNPAEEQTIFEDFTFCHECDYYDRNDRLCKLFKCVRICGCQSGKEKKPSYLFEQIKQMAMEEMAELLFRKFQDIYEAVTKDGAHFGKRDMMLWLMEGVDHES